MLENSVCLVTGASRGIGKGIALGLGQSGAIVYITGRTLKPKGDPVGGSLEETAAEINSRGGKAIPVVVDHSKESEVIELFNQIRREQNGRLDVLVNNAYSGVSVLTSDTNKMFFEVESLTPGEYWDAINNVGLRNHYICATLASRMMLEYRKQEISARPGLIVNISSFGAKRYLFGVAYGVGKAAIDRMTRDMNIELKRRKANICIISLWPGIVRTEMLTRHIANSSKALAEFLDPSTSESPELSGLAVAAIASEDASKMRKRAGDIVLVSDVAHQYNLREPDGHAPPDYRSLKTVFRLMRFPFLWLIPGFIRIPKCVFVWFLGKGQ